MAPPYDTYTFQSEPRALRTRPKFRPQQEPPVQSGYGNLMHDPRVVRGSTFKQQAMPSVDPVAIQKQQEKRRLQQAKARAKAKLKPRDVEPVAGRAHIEVQTELYLEELTDRVEETDQSVQTDPFLDRPPEPLFIPAKTGVDAETQIEDGELFDFDLESKPILEVLVGKTMEQSLLEVMEEEELDALRDHQAEFEELRNAELIETQRLEEQARRRREERERRLLQQAEVAQQERETTEKVAARSFAQSYLSGLVPSVFDNLDANGYFYDSQEREIEEVFLPWLLNGVDENIAKQQQGREILDALIRDVVMARAAKYGTADGAEEQMKVEVAIEAIVDTAAADSTPAEDSAGSAVPATEDAAAASTPDGEQVSGAEPDTADSNSDPSSTADDTNLSNDVKPADVKTAEGDPAGADGAEDVPDQPAADDPSADPKTDDAE